MKYYTIREAKTNLSELIRKRATATRSLSRVAANQW
jgi:hypothetical protein